MSSPMTVIKSWTKLLQGLIRNLNLWKLISSTFSCVWPNAQRSVSFQKYGTVSDNIKLYVRRVFIINDILPQYLGFVKGVVDSDDSPLNVSRETLQQHNLLKVIPKKLVRKALDMFKKLNKDDMEKFWKEYSTNMNLGIIEDPAIRTRLAKLLRFQSYHSDKGMTTMAEYVSRMKPKQEHIYYVAGPTRTKVEKCPEESKDDHDKL